LPTSSQPAGAYNCHGTWLLASRCRIDVGFNWPSGVSIASLHWELANWKPPLVPANLWRFLFRSLARGVTRRVNCEKLLYAKDQITGRFLHGKVAGAPFGGSGICCGAILRCGVSSQLVARCLHRARPGHNPPGAPNCHGPNDGMPDLSTGVQDRPCRVDHD